MHLRSLTVVLALAFALPAAPSLAQNGDADLVQLEHFTLTMDNITRFFETVNDLGSAAKADPTLKDKLSTDADKHENFTQIEARLSSQPAIASAIKAHGFTPHTFVLTEFAMIQASMAAAMKPAGENSAAYAAKVHVNPANLDFINQHKDEFAALQKKYKSLESSD